MSRRERREAARRAAAAPAALPDVTPSEPPVPRAGLWLALAFLLPNLGALFCGFVYDDIPLIVENARLHSLSRLGEVLTGGYWPDRSGLTLYRPVTQGLESLLWALGGGTPLPFHLVNLLLGTAVVLLVHRLLVSLRVPSRTAFLASLLFALLPIHTEATTAIVGVSELLAAGLGVAALLSYRSGRRVAALALFALAVLSKESAAAIAGLALLLPFVEPGPRSPWKRLAVDAAGAGAVVALALVARRLVAFGPDFIPPIDNPMSLVHPLQRILTALWTQVLYLRQCLFPLVLSADYSYKEIPLVMGPDDARAWAGIALLGLAAWAFRYRPATRVPILLWAVPFLPAANLLMPVGTVMGERLAYLPSLGLCLLVAPLLLRVPRKEVVVGAICLAFAARTAVRNLDWRSADTFYPKLVATSPGSAKVWYFLGCWKAAREDDPGALAAYDEAIRIFQPYPEAWNNRAGTLLRLGRKDEAKESYRQAVRFDPGHKAAAASLQAMEAGIPFTAKRPRV